MARGSRLGLRRTWPQRILLVAGVLLMVTSSVSAYYLHDVYGQLGAIPRIAVGAGVLAPQPPAGQPRNILLIGSTENSGIDSSDPLRAGRSDAALADTIMLVRVDPSARTAAVMTINRDLWVPIPGSSENKINAANAIGGPDLLVRTVSSYLNVPVNDFARINFAGFRRLVDDIGGVPVNFPYAARDLGSFFDAPPGCWSLNGEQALNYVRSRHYEQLKNGKWTSDPTSDFGRTQRQRDFLILAMDRVFASNGRSPSAIQHLVNVATSPDPSTGVSPIELDTELTPQNLLDLGRAFSNFDPSALQRIQLPSHPDTAGRLSILRLDEAAAQPLLDVFRGASAGTAAPAPAPVSLVDARGSRDSVDGTKAALKGHGFPVTSSSRQSHAVANTAIRYDPGQRDAAVLLARFVAPLPDLQPVAGLGQPELVLGSDFQAIRLAPRTDDEMSAVLAAPPSTVTTTSAKSGSSATARGVTTTAPTTVAPTTAPTPPTTTSEPVVGLPPDGAVCKALPANPN